MQQIASADLERDAWIDAATHADPAAISAARLSVIDLGGAAVLRCRAGGPLTNRAYGTPPDPDTLRAIGRHYAAAHVPLYFIEIDDADPARAAAAAVDVGLVRYRRGMLDLMRGTGHMAPSATAFDVGLARRSEMLRVAEIYCAAFDADRVLAPVFVSLFDAPRWRFVVARTDGEPIAVGILFVAGEAAYLMGAATRPRSRAMGAQGALVAARVALARDLGCRMITARTGEPAPGDLQHSHHNLIRNGFLPVGRTDSYAPPGTVWTHGRRSVAAT